MAGKLPIKDLGISKENLQQENNPVINLTCQDLEGYTVEDYSKISRPGARGGDYLNVTFKNETTGATYSLPALLTCGLSVIESWSSITLQLKGYAGRNGRVNWTPWIVKFNPE